jgi:hypothetical protein
VCAAEVAKKARKIGELYVKAKSETSRGKVFSDVFLVCVCACFVLVVPAVAFFHGRRTHSAEAPRTQILPKSARRVMKAMDAQTAGELCSLVVRALHLSASSLASSVPTQA